MLSLLFFVALSFCASAAYPYIGYSDYSQGRSYITNAAGFTTYGKTLTSVDSVPVVADLDADGDDELVIADNTNIRIYSLPSLGVLQAYSTDIASGKRDIIAMNIDADAYTEIITNADADGNISILQYNGSTLVLQAEHNADHLKLANDNVMGCDSASKRCIVMGTSGSSTGILYAYGFNDSAISSAVSIYSTGGRVHCGPRQQSMSVKDIDADGTVEFVSSWTEFVEPGSEVMWIRSLVLTGITPSQEDSDNRGLYDATTTTGCANGNGRLVSAPLCYDFDGASGNGLECVVAYQYDADEFRVRAYVSSLNTYTEFPQLLGVPTEAEGRAFSNPYRGVVFPDSPADFCVSGYNGESASMQLDVVCGSLNTGESPPSAEFIMTQPHGLPSAYGVTAGLSHAYQGSSALTDSVDLNEALTSYGSVLLPYATCTLGGCDAALLFTPPVENMTLYAVDIAGLGRSDYVAISGTNLYYYDDGYSDQAPEFTSYTINPCTDSTWKLNTTASVSFVATDAEAQQVTGQAVLYSGTSQAIRSEKVNSTSGATFIFGFVANTTIGSGTILMNATDSTGHSATQSVAFSVGITGVSFGDCTTSEDLTAPAAAGTNLSQLPSAGNDAEVLMQQVSNATGFGSSLLWTIFMAGGIIACLVLGFRAGWPGVVVLSMCLLLMAVMLIMGGLLGFIGTGVIIFFVLMLIFVIGVWVKSAFAGGTG